MLRGTVPKAARFDRKIARSLKRVDQREEIDITEKSIRYSKSEQMTIENSPHLCREDARRPKAALY